MHAVGKYSKEEWGGRIASVGRLKDCVRNSPDNTAAVLMGRGPAFLGRGLFRDQSPKALDPEVIPAVVFWTKGPVEKLIEHEGLRAAVDLYNGKQAVVGLQLSVTGLGGTFLEPGIPSPQETANGLRKVIQSGLIDPGAIVLRYDPVLKVETAEGRVISNARTEAFTEVVNLFAPLGVRRIETKFLLAPENQGEKYDHVWQRLNGAGLKVLPLADIGGTFAAMAAIAARYGVELFSCCVAVEQAKPGWSHDAGCLSADQLREVGKRRFGVRWDRLSYACRSSRKGCQCSQYYDLSNVEGMKQCGSGTDSAACLYCTACARTFSAAVQDKVREEIDQFAKGTAGEKYRHLISS